MNIKETVALVTGANRGLGLELTKALITAGVKKVYAAARDPKSITTPGAIPVRLDVTKVAEIKALSQELGDVTLVINNAGVYRNYTFLGENEASALKDSFDTNVFGLLEVSKAFAPILARNGGGTIANMLSVLAWVAFPGTTAYSASKAAALLVTDGLRAELAPQRTQVSAIHAGYIDTDMGAGAEGPKNDPAEVAQKILSGLERGDQEIIIDGISAQVKSGLSQPKPGFGH